MSSEQGYVGVRVPPGAPRNFFMYKKAKEYFITTVKNAGSKYDYLLRHLSQVERWAKKLLVAYPEADEDIIMIGVWLHDIGRVLGDKEVDHAVNSEIEVKSYLKELELDESLIDKVAHCVRAHRCKDIQPDTIEAKIIAAADSASHMTDTVYIDVSNRGEFTEALQKLERDYRDIGVFPELQKSLKPFYVAWKKLLEVYPKEL